MNIKKQLRIHDAFGFFAALRIPDAVWVVLLTARGFRLWQVGLAEGIFHIVSLLCEIPSGMVADLIGRRRTLVAAGLFGVTSAVFMMLSTGFAGICLSMVFSALACSFLSGSDEALLYDSLVDAGEQDRYLTVNARYVQIQNLGSILSNAASLLTGLLGYIGIYLTDAAVCLVRACTAHALTEPAVTQEQIQRQQSPFAYFAQRFRQHLQSVKNFLFAYPRVGLVMLSDGFLTLPSFLTLMFLQQRLTELGVSTLWLGLPVMCISLSRMAGVAAGKQLRPKKLSGLFACCSLIVGIGTIFAGSAPVILAVLGAMIAAGTMEAWTLHLQNHLNNLFPSDQRATLVSMNMMAYSVLMIIASPLTGWLGDVVGAAGAGICILGALIVCAGCWMLLKNLR